MSSEYNIILLILLNIIKDYLKETSEYKIDL